MRQEKVTRNVTLKGIRPIMFDRYAGDNKTMLNPEDKLYLDKDRGLVMPSENLQSFLCAENTNSAAKMFYDSRVYKKVCLALRGFVTVDELTIPIIRDGEQIKMEGFGKNGISLHKSVARLAKGIPNPKERPLVDTPWEIKFTMTIWPNDEVAEQEVRMLFDRGGMAIGLGTYRGVYGKFVISDWK